MLVETENPEIVRALEHTVSVIRSTGGFVSDYLIVRERGGHFSCALADRIPAGELLVEYDPELSLPMHLVKWSDSNEVLEVSQLPAEITDTQCRLLEDWLILVNTTDKLRRVRESLPRFGINSWPLRHHLAAAGYPSMRERSDLAELKRITVNWHCRYLPPDMPDPETGEQLPGMGLIPLKHLVNHHPQGSIQRPVPGKVAVVSSAVAGTDETFENYGNLDSLKLLLGFGFRADFAPVVHSIPLSVPSDVGRIKVEWVASRGAQQEVGLKRDVPVLRPDDDGLVIHDLTFRPDNRTRISSLLTMALTARGELSPQAAEHLAHKTLDSIVEANIAYYRTLDDLVMHRLGQLADTSRHPVGAATLSHDVGNAISQDLPPLRIDAERTLLNELAMVSLIQQNKINEWWTR